MESQAARGFELLLVLVGAVAFLGFLLGVHRDTRDFGSVTHFQPTLPSPQVAETERDGALRVLVTGRDKAPLANARIRVFSEQNRRYFDAGQGTSDGSGRAELLRVPRGRLWLVVEAEGYARASSQLVMEGGVREVVLELAPAKLLSVRVTDEAHAPIREATVLVTTHDPLPYGALTDVNGTALLDRLAAPPYIVKASAPGYESVTRSGVDANLELVLRSR